MRHVHRSVALGSLVFALSFLPYQAAFSVEPALPSSDSGTSKAKPAAGSPDLRPEFRRLGLKRRSQGGRGTCSVFTMTAAVEYALGKRTGKADSRLSIEFLNWASNQVTGRPDDGSYFSDLWDGFKAHGICPENAMPYRAEFDPVVQPSAEATGRAKPLCDAGLHMHWIKAWNPNFGASARQLERIKRVLANGWPVCGGFLWPKGGHSEWKDGVLQIRPRDQMMDGHSVLLVGWRDDPAQPGGGVFWIRNSNGGPRNQALSYEYIRTYMNDALWVDYSADANPPDEPEGPEEKPADSSKPRQKPWWAD